MNFFSNCSRDCCICANTSGCVTGHGGNDFTLASKEKIIDNLDKGFYRSYRQLMIDTLRKSYEYDYEANHKDKTNKNTIIFNKLVRDKIPEIIANSGSKCTFEILSDEEYITMLDKKLDEELAEYHKDKDIEELADLLEVIYACAQARGYSLDDLEKFRINKATERGTFKNKILLKIMEL